MDYFAQKLPFTYKIKSISCPKSNEDSTKRGHA